MMHGSEKSDLAIVAKKPVNKDALASAELVEPRAGPRGTRASKARAGHRTGKACHRRWSAYGMSCRQAPEVGAGCGNTARPDLCGGRSVMSVPTAIPAVYGRRMFSTFSYIPGGVSPRARVGSATASTTCNHRALRELRRPRHPCQGTKESGHPQ